MATKFSDSQSLKFLKEYLPASYRDSAKHPAAWERVHNAATIAGIAFAKALLWERVIPWSINWV